MIWLYVISAVGTVSIGPLPITEAQCWAQVAEMAPAVRAGAVADGIDPKTVGFACVPMGAGA